MVLLIVGYAMDPLEECHLQSLQDEYAIDLIDLALDLAVQYERHDQCLCIDTRDAQSLCLSLYHAVLAQLLTLAR